MSLRRDWMHESKLGGSWKNVYRKVFYRWLIRKYLKNCATVVDVGCGHRIFMEILSAEGKVAYGIDLDIEEQPDIYKMDYRKVPIEQKWDCVYSSQFIEHVDGQELAKWCCERARKKVVIITGRATRDFWDDPTHTRPYTKKAVRCLLEEQGFSVILNVNLWPTHSHITVATKNGN